MCETKTIHISYDEKVTPYIVERSAWGATRCCRPFEREKIYKKYLNVSMNYPNAVVVVGAKDISRRYIRCGGCLFFSGEDPAPIIIITVSFPVFDVTNVSD